MRTIKLPRQVRGAVRQVQEGGGTKIHCVVIIEHALLQWGGLQNFTFLVNCNLRMSAVKSFAFVPMNIFAFANCFFILRCFLAKERAFPFCIILHGGACQHEMCTLLTEFLSFD